MKKNDDLAPYFKSLALIFIFVCLSGLALAFREVEIFGAVVQGNDAQPAEAGLCGSFPRCFRLVTMSVRTLIDNGLLFLAGALDLLPSRPDPKFLTLEIKHSFLVIFGGLVTRMLSLSPILIACFVAYRHFFTRLLLMIIVFVTIFGWARSNPLFSEQYIVSYDYPAIGFMFLLYVLIARGITRTFFRASVVLILAQLIFENLGMVTGVAVVLHEFMMNRDGGMRKRTVSALRKLFGFGVVSLGVAGLIYGTAIWSFDNVYWVSEGKSFLYTYEFYGRNNFVEVYDIVENTLELLAYPVLFGIILGLLSRYLFDTDECATDELRNEFWASFAIWIGFLGTILIGMFVSGIYYEMGRQFLPFACITGLVSAKAVPVLLAGARRG